MSDIQVFDFETSPVRSVEIEGEPWFVGKDVCECLEVKDHHQALDRLDDDEVYGGYSIPTIKGQRETKVISEPGVYRLVFTSRTEKSERFKRWLAHEVLPALRKTGAYAIEEKQTVTIENVDELRSALALVREYRVLYGRPAARELVKQIDILPDVETLKNEELVPYDDILEFTKSMLKDAPGERTTAKDLYTAYIDWCKGGQVPAKKQCLFGRRLRALGYSKCKSGGNVWYEGVVLG